MNISKFEIRFKRNRLRYEEEHLRSYLTDFLCSWWKMGFRSSKTSSFQEGVLATRSYLYVTFGGGSTSFSVIFFFSLFQFLLTLSLSLSTLFLFRFYNSYCKGSNWTPINGLKGQNDSFASLLTLNDFVLFSSVTFDDNKKGKIICNCTKGNNFVLLLNMLF